MMQRALAIFALGLLITTAADAKSSVNKSVRVAAGEILDESVSSVNGSVDIGSGAEIGGSAKSVNGSVDVGDDARTRSVSSVNGSVDVGDRVSVDGDVTTVNGSLRVGRESTVAGSVETVNGRIDLRGAMVERDLRTKNGGIVLDDGAVVQGDILVESSRNRNRWNKEPLEIKLRGGSSVEGDIRVDEDRSRKVLVILSEGSEVRGQIEGAEVIRR